MERNAIKSLKKWKISKKLKPLVLRGARQVGKTWLMKEFGKEYFDNVAYINFDEDSSSKQIFENDYDIERIILALEIQSNQKITSGKSLIILDEVQEAPRAITSLKYFNENASDYHIIAAGSLLGIASLEGTGFPVGKVDFLDIYPMSFTEFLNAMGLGRFLELLKNQDWINIKVFENKLIEALRHYFFVGGMPEVVASYIENKDFVEVRNLQNSLLDAYQRDFSKHAPKEIVSRIRLVWGAIPSQLAKENKKFIYNNIRRNSRAKEFEVAIQWLKDAGLIHKVLRIKKANIPLNSYQDSVFKMFSLDVGLLAAQSNLDSKSIINGNQIFTEFKGSLTEQFVLQQLISNCSITPYYWSAENSIGEVDFILQYRSKVIPLEVKAEKNLKAKSLLSFSRKNKSLLAARTSMSSYNLSSVSAPITALDKSEFDFELLDIPLFAMSEITTVIDSIMK